MYRYLLLFLVASASAQTHCIVNEIMYAPLAGEPEWVEVYNPTSQQINIKNWKIRDLTATKKTLTTKDAFIAPRGFVVLSKDTTIYNYHFAIDAPVIALSLPSLNNDSDAVIIYDAAGAVVDSLVYHNTWGGTGGASLERVRAGMPSSIASNWKTSRDLEKSSPGRRNSVAPQPLDAALDTVSARLTGVNTFTVTAALHNEGELSIDTNVVRFGIDVNNDGIIGPGELYHEEAVGTMPAGSARTFSAETPRLISSTHVIVELLVPGDGDSSNNRKSLFVIVSHTEQCAVINEIMYAPTAPEPEWIELQNRSTDTLSCTGWTLSTGSTAYPISTTPLLGPGDYIVLTKDTGALVELYPAYADRIVFDALPTLSNSGGKVLLRDEQSTLIDSVAYRVAWGGVGGRSLERVDSSAPSNDSSNWSGSVDTAHNTCGRRNSNARAAHDVGVQRVALSDDSTQLIVTLRNAGLRSMSDVFVGAQIDSMPPQTGALSSMLVALGGGNTMQVEIPIGTLPAGDNQITVWTKADDDERSANDSVRITVRGSLPYGALTVNEIMYAPRSGNAEYVEIVNTDSVLVNLLGCTLSGNISTTTHHADTLAFGSAPCVLLPNEYAVIASDTTLYGSYANLPEHAHVLVLGRSSLNLTNDSDFVVIENARGQVLDSVHYNSAWHSPNVHTTTGISLERVNPRLPSNEKSSWASSVSSTGGTPCATNSVFTIVNVATGALMEPPTATLEAAPNPFSPDGDGFEDLTILHYTLPFETATYTLRIFNTAGRELRVIVNTGRSSHDGTIVWDGRDNDGIPLPVGMYIAVMDGVDAESGSVVRARAAVIVAKRM